MGGKVGGWVAGVAGWLAGQLGEAESKLESTEQASKTGSGMQGTLASCVTDRAAPISNLTAPTGISSTHGTPFKQLAQHHCGQQLSACLGAPQTTPAFRMLAPPPRLLLICNHGTLKPRQTD